ncbi:MAG TPA: hypothetical protein VK699_20750 [Terriglobales bacterium]|nr:hypothetical protein [Terriglobales bacterium]
MRLKSVFSFFSLLLVFSCAALGQAPANLIASAPAAGPATGLPDAAVAPAAVLPEAPIVEPTMALPEAAAVMPAAVMPEPPVVRQAIGLPEAPSHRFFDKTNLWLHLGAVSAETADLITTRRVIQLGGREGDPLARPFVRAGIGGQMVGTYVLGEGSSVLASYLLHRSGHHRLERFVPIAVSIVESLAAASNIRTEQRIRARSTLIH